MGNVLIVDDDALIREITKDLLTGAGHAVFTAKDTLEGLDLLKKEEINAVILDIVMPLHSGFEMIPQIKKVNTDISIIIMTAFASLDSAIEAIRMGAYDYIRKPLKEEEVLHAVNRGMERNRLLVENSSLTQRLEERIKRLELFETISRAVSSTLDLQKLLEKIMDITKSVLGAEACSVLLLDEAKGELVFTVALGEKSEEVREFRIKSGQGIAGWVLQHGEPLLITDIKTDGRYYRELDDKTGFETRSMIAVPLLVKDKSVGVIEVINKVIGSLFDKVDEDTLVTMAGQIAVAVDNAKMAEDLKRSKEQIEGYSKNLEEMVYKRTGELQKINMELKAAQAQLLQTEKLSSLGQLAAGIAHEINNPIGFINSNLRTMGEYREDLMRLIEKYEALANNIKSSNNDLLSSMVDDLADTKMEIRFDFIMSDFSKLIQESRDGAFRVYKIVRDLRGFARADDAERKFVDIHASLDSTLNIVWNELKYKADVIMDYGDIPEVECLPTQLNQVFMNILVNAAHSIKNRGKITIKTYSEGERVFVEISDTGAGIPEGNLTKIFDPFFTTKEPGKGTGLGLSIVYGIIKKHNGEIKVKSKLGEGTTFIIELPVKMAAPEGGKE
ncbi:MAG: Response regulator [Deltaproteobacteria bacterium]|nr:Response regulator [Deltaproteobacteria bacterium]